MKKTYSIVALIFMAISIIGCKKKDDCLPPRLEITSNQPVYTGESVIFDVVSEPGATFLWTGPNNFTSTEQSPVISSAGANAAGDYTVTAKSGSCEKTETVSVDIIPAPPCTPANNSISFFSTMTFSNVFFGINSSGRYELSGSGLQGDFVIEFYNETLQKGNFVYQLSTMDNNSNNARMQIDIGGVLTNWQATSGSLYLRIVNNKVTVTFCNAIFGNIQSSSTKAGSGKLSAS